MSGLTVAISSQLPAIRALVDTQFGMCPAREWARSMDI